VSDKMERIDAQRYRIGEQVFIRYDPARPSASIWLGRDDLASARASSTAELMQICTVPGARAALLCL
jgi:hypothetical protein